MNEELRKAVKKYNKIYVIELFVIAAVIIVLATLKLLGVIGSSQTFRRVFNSITTVGATYIITDFVWLCCSKKRQKRNSWFDKISLLPFAAALIVIDVIGFINWNAEEVPFFSAYVAIAFYYIAAIYIAQGIYHIYKPNPSIVLAAVQEYNEKQAELAKQQEEAKPQEENKE